MRQWSFACPDWQRRIRNGLSLVPELPLYEDEARDAIAFFDRLRLPEVLGEPTMAEACGAWFRDIVRAVFGSRDPATNIRYVREVFALVGKGNSKTTYSAGLMIVALLMNIRKRVEFHFIAPVRETAEVAYDAAKGMIEIDPELAKRFHCRDHKKEIYDRVNKCRMRVKTFDLKVATGPKPAGILLDELHVMGKSIHTAKIMRQIRGGLEKNTDSFLIMITTQSDEPPAGAFKDELNAARDIRDGKVKGRTLPILYEFPDDIARDEAKWSRPENWHMVMPNLGRSLQLASLVEDFEAECRKGIGNKKLWASQHISIEIGIGLRSDRWPGAEFWPRSEEVEVTLDWILEHCEVVVPGVDGGGLDDLFGLTVLGRHRETKVWYSWSHAWCHVGVLDRRQSIATVLRDFEKAGDLTIVDDELADISAIVEIIARIKDLGLLAAVAVDPAGLGEFADALAEIEITRDNKLLIGAPQGYAMMNAIKTTERKLANGTLKHAPSKLMAWCVGNLKIEPTATAIRATKQNAGDAKIDPVMALFDAATVMSLNPVAMVTKSPWEDETFRLGAGVADVAIQSKGT